MNSLSYHFHPMQRVLFFVGSPTQKRSWICARALAMWGNCCSSMLLIRTRNNHPSPLYPSGIYSQLESQAIPSFNHDSGSSPSFSLGVGQEYQIPHFNKSLTGFFGTVQTYYIENKSVGDQTNSEDWRSMLPSVCNSCPRKILADHSHSSWM